MHEKDVGVQRCSTGNCFVVTSLAMEKETDLLCTSIPLFQQLIARRTVLFAFGGFWVSFATWTWMDTNERQELLEWVLGFLQQALVVGMVVRLHLQWRESRFWVLCAAAGLDCKNTRRLRFLQTIRSRHGLGNVAERTDGFLL